MNERTESENEHGILTRSEDSEETTPLQQIAAALLCYSGVVSVTEARELAGFAPETDDEHTRNMRILARFIRDTGRAVPLSLAGWWPDAGHRRQQC